MSTSNEGPPAGGVHILMRGRRARGESDHHGGAWKIAYADFMTAMMAFFLVMWLVNATDEKTIVQVAAYFNPLRLTEKSPSQKGLHDGNVASVQGSGQGATREPTVPPDEVKEQAAKSRGRRRQEEPAKVEQQLLSAPEETLDRIEARVASGYLAPRAAGTAEIRDPWLPVREQPGAVAAGPGQAGGRDAPRPEAPAGKPAAADAPSAPNAPRVAGGDEGKQAAPAAATPQAVAAGLARDIDELVARVRGRHPKLEVRLTRDGVLVSLMDDKGFGMFAIASAEPRPEVVVLLREVGALLARRPGGIVISGHTDGRPYRTSAYDNWRLSTSRGHAVRVMLARGGLDDRRIERVEGHADRSPRNPDDADAAENRRIDILLRVAS